MSPLSIASSAKPERTDTEQHGHGGRSLRRLGRFIPIVALLGGAVLLGASATQAATSTAPTVSPSELAHAGQLTICSDFPNPPQEFYTTQGKPIGSDVDTGNAIAARLRLKPVWTNTVFDTILEALAAGKCDLVISGVFITPQREKVVRFIPYINSGEQLMVAKGNPAHISNSYASLCGKSISTQLGDSENVTAQKWSKECQAHGKAKITILDPPNESSALEELITQHVVAHFNDAPVVQYYAHKSPSQFQLVTPAINPVAEGIAIAKGKTSLYAAVRTVLRSMESDGSYKAILAKWGLQSSTIPPIR